MSYNNRNGGNRSGGNNRGYSGGNRNDEAPKYKDRLGFAEAVDYPHSFISKKKIGSQVAYPVVWNGSGDMLLAQEAALILMPDYSADEGGAYTLGFLVRPAAKFMSADLDGSDVEVMDFFVPIVYKWSVPKFEWNDKYGRYDVKLFFPSLLGNINLYFSRFHDVPEHLESIVPDDFAPDDYSGEWWDSLPIWSMEISTPYQQKNDDKGGGNRGNGNRGSNSGGGRSGNSRNSGGGNSRSRRNDDAPLDDAPPKRETRSSRNGGNNEDSSRRSGNGGGNGKSSERSGGNRRRKVDDDIPF